MRKTETNIRVETCVNCNRNPCSWGEEEFNSPEADLVKVLSMSCGICSEQMNLYPPSAEECLALLTKADKMLAESKAGKKKN